MIKYFLTNEIARLGEFNTETEEFKAIRYNGSYISDTFIAPEDGMLDNTEIHKGDVILWMYPVIPGSDKEAIVITDEKLKDYYKRMNEQIEQQRKENYRCGGDCIASCCPDSGR